MKHNKLAVAIILSILALVCVFGASCSSGSSDYNNSGVIDYDDTGGTLVQESGVDEGDIVKMFGENIYKLQTNGLRVFKAEEGIITPVAYYDFTSERSIPLEMYVTDEAIVVIYGRTKTLDYYKNYSAVYSSFYDQSYTRVFVDIFQNPNADSFTTDLSPVDGYGINLATLKTYSFDMNAQLVASRMKVDGKMLLFAFSGTDQFTYTTGDDSSSGDIITLDGETRSVTYRENGESITFDGITLIPGVTTLPGTHSPTIFMSINADDPSTGCTLNGVYGSILKDIYMSEDSIVPIFETAIYERKKIGSGCFASYRTAYNKNTYLIKISAETLTVVDGVSLVNYDMYDRRAIKDYGDVIYIAATKRDGSGTTVIALDSERFSLLNKLEQLAPNEDVKSVTFGEEDGKRYCYITTYLNIDPLFKVDITDPYNMETLGYLEMPGYSTYMLSVGDRLITVGYADDGAQGSESEIKIALYDTAGDQVSSLDEVTISNVIYCEAITDPRVIAVFDTCFALSMTISGKTVQQLMFVFDTTGDEINVIARLSNFGETSTNVFSTEYYDDENLSPTTDYGVFALSVSRARYYDGYIYTFSDGAITSYKVTEETDGTTIVRTVSEEYTQRFLTNDSNQPLFSSSSVTSDTGEDT